MIRIGIVQWQRDHGREQIILECPLPPDLEDFRAAVRGVERGTRANPAPLRGGFWFTQCDPRVAGAAARLAPLVATFLRPLRGCWGMSNRGDGAGGFGRRSIWEGALGSLRWRCSHALPFGSPLNGAGCGLFNGVHELLAPLRGWLHSWPHSSAPPGRIVFLRCDPRVALVRAAHGLRSTRGYSPAPLAGRRDAWVSSWRARAMGWSA